MNKMRKILQSFMWINVGQYCPFVIKFLGSIYLARMIDPVFFGQQGLAFAISSLMWSFVMLGEEPALIRQQRDIDNYLRMLLFVRVCIVIALSVIIASLWLLKWLPGSPQIKFYTVMLFLSEIPAQIGAIYNAYITKYKFFIRLALISTFSSFCAVVLACVLASLGWNVWALLWLLMTERMLQGFLSIFLAKKLFLPKFNKHLALSFFHYSKYIVCTSVLDRLSNKVADISIGSLIGEAKLGFYQRANSLGNLFQMLLGGGVATFIQPHFADMQDEKQRLGRHFEFISCLLLRISCATFFCFAIIMPAVVLWLYREKWLPAVPIFRILLPFAVLQTYRSVIRQTHQIAGSVQKLTLAQITEVIILILLLYPMIYWKGVMGVAVAVDFSVVVGVFFMLFLFKRHAVFSIRKIFCNPIIASVCATCFVWISGLANDRNPTVSSTAGAVIIFFAGYLVLLCVLEYSFIMQICTWLKQGIEPRRV